MHPNELGSFENVEGKVSINYVGYYYSAELKDCVFILPKVLITVGENKQELAFGEHRPEDIINIDKDRDGSISKHKAKKAPDFLFLYNVDEPTTEGLMMFKIHNTADTPYEFMKKTHYPGLKEGRNYVSYILEQDPITFGDIDICRLLNDYKSSHQEYKKGEPIYMLGSELKQYRKS